MSKAARSEAAAILGSGTSPKKARASRANGQLGGRQPEAIKKAFAKMKRGQK